MGRKKIPVESIDSALAARLTGIGLTMAQVADVLGVSKDTLERRAKESDELRLAISQGRSKAAAKVCETAFNMATSGALRPPKSKRSRRVPCNEILKFELKRSIKTLLAPSKSIFVTGDNGHICHETFV